VLEGECRLAEDDERLKKNKSDTVVKRWRMGMMEISILMVFVAEEGVVVEG
jgi:hypothetical protein